MALLKTISLPDGSTVEYHKVSRINSDYINATAEVFVASYRTQAARAAGKEPALYNSYNVPSEDFPFTVEDINPENQNEIKAAYIWLKTVDDWSDATDA